MSGAIGRITAALATFHNENSVSLVNLNVDFTLIKMEAPPEFRGVGSTISEHRKSNAEDGAVHKTARKLGALFEAVIPPTPELFKKYGTRVSELSQSTKINPKPSSRDGMFACHIGADSTSIWAAVTSGDGAIGVHLLACMLARMWSGPEAISIWNELIVKRREEIQQQSATATYPSKYDSDVLAAKQEISREELAGWDASARAWVQSADQVESRRHTQLMLILDNINIPVNIEKNLYKSVTTAWFAALQAMENLVKGVSLQIHDGAALLGLSSWHLYPDMVVLGGVTAEVKQQDPLIPSSAMMTLGLQFADQSRHGVSWSLPLAHLRYYGHPVQSSCAVGPANSRISFDQFSYLILGCVFGGWKEYGSTPTIGVSWLMRLHDLLEKFPKRLEEKKTIEMRQFAKHEGNPFPMTTLHTIQSSKSWIEWLFNAGQRLLDSKGHERKVATQLVALGKRRATALCPDQSIPSPIFGLSDPSILIPILTDDESRIKFLRGIASKLSLDGPRHIIRYKRDSFIDGCPFEYATAREVPSPGSPLLTTHKRFLPFTAYHRNTQVLACVCSPLCTGACPCRLRTTECSLLCHHQHGNRVKLCGNNGILNLLILRSAKIEENAETPEPLCELQPYWDKISPENILVKFCSGPSFEESLVGLSRQESGTPLRDFVGLKFVCGHPDVAAIFELHYTRNVITPGAPISETAPLAKSYIQQELLVDVLQVDMLDANRLVEWLTTFKKPRTPPLLARHTTAPGFISARDVRESSPTLYSEYSSSLRVGVIATEVYKLIPDATISATVVSQSLWLSKWLPPQPKECSHLLSEVELTRAQAFACIAMFDSGSCNLDPAGLQEAFAISSGNSIYVAAPLLCDPYEVPTPKEIRRVTGSLGRSGLTVLVPPSEPKCRARDDESWCHVNHLPFEGKLENCFQQTTIHLSFTAYELPLSDGSHGQHIIDRPASLVETVVSVHDRGKWIADLDILSALKKREGDDHKLQSLQCGCWKHDSNKRKAVPNFDEIFGAKGEPLISIDNWDEFLDFPFASILVVRAHQNWLGRLAFTVMSVNHGHSTLVLPEDICWLCCKESLNNTTHKDARSTVLVC
jgi:hypothetical protein